MLITKKTIISRIKKETGLKDIELDKFDGEYYWIGKVAALFDETCTYYRTLNHPNVPLEYWVNNCKKKIEKAEEIHGKPIQELVDSIDWNI